MKNEELITLRVSQGKRQLYREAISRIHHTDVSKFIRDKLEYVLKIAKKNKR